MTGYCERDCLEAVYKAKLDKIRELIGQWEKTPGWNPAAEIRQVLDR